MPILGTPHRFCSRSILLVGCVLFLSNMFAVGARAAENVRPLDMGEAFLTRFSGVVETRDKEGEKATILDVNGVVGSVIDLRFPLASALGQHWRNEPQRFEIIASEVGQVFGVAFDNATPPNIYVSATSAFGLHRNKDKSDWAAGMWGKGGAPGTIYKLNAKYNYAPEIFAQVTLGGRLNSGPALGNLAFDQVGQQLFVSDLETGMIHRFDIKTGRDLGHYDHGVTGRSQFLDREIGALSQLKPEHFKADCVAQTKDCKAAFANTPSCWNYASANRRVWGLDVRTMPDGSRRLFYATWGSVDGVNLAKGTGGQNEIWSIGLDKDGSFALDDVALEFTLPTLVVDEKIAFSAPSDLSFSRSGALLIGERGAPRNYLGRYQSPFARPTISRSFEYVLGFDGRWKMVGQYDVGNRSVTSTADLTRFDNSAGGVAWGFGYNKFGKIDVKSPDEFVWLSGDSLCSKMGACFDTNSKDFDDRHHVVGIEGRGRGFFRGNVERSLKIDSDINVRKNGKVNFRQTLKNDDSQGAGDVEVYQGRDVVQKSKPISVVQGKLNKQHTAPQKVPVIAPVVVKKKPVPIGEFKKPLEWKGKNPPLKTPLLAGGAGSSGGAVILKKLPKFNPPIQHRQILPPFLVPQQHMKPVPAPRFAPPKHLKPLSVLPMKKHGNAAKTVAKPQVTKPQIAKPQIAKPQVIIEPKKLGPKTKVEPWEDFVTTPKVLPKANIVAKDKTVAKDKVTPKDKVLPMAKGVPKIKAAPKTELEPAVTVPVVLPKEKPKQVFVKKQLAEKKLKRVNAKSKKGRIVKKKVRSKVRKKAGQKFKRRVLRKRVKSQIKRKARRKKTKPHCDCDAPVTKNRKIKRVLHPGGKADYSGAGKVRVFVPSRP